MNLENFLEDKIISRRTYNVLTYNNLSTIDNLLDKIRASGGIDKLKLLNAGKGTKIEIEKLIVLIVGDIPAFEDFAASNQLYQPSFMAGLSKLQISLLDKKIKLFFEDLSQRSKNAISTFLKEDLSFKNIFSNIFSQIEFKINRLPNIGKKSEEDIEFFLARIISEHHFTIEAGNDVLLENQNYIELESLFNISSEYLRTYPLIDGENKIKLLKLIEVYLFYKNPDERFNIIYQYLFTKKSEKANLRTLASQLNITRERVRQIIYKFDEIIDEKLAVFNRIDRSLYNTYISNSSDFLFINLVQCNKINEKENTQFSQKFLSVLFAYLYKEKYILFPNNIDDFDNYYLIDKLLFEVFKFEDFYNEIRNILNTNIKEDLEIDLLGFAYKYVSKSEKVLEDINRITPIIEEVLFQEFSPKLMVMDGIITIRKNVRVSSKDILVQILTTLGKPSNIEDIIKQAAIQFEDLQIAENNIRPLLKEKHLFNYYGRSSTYGLVKWEKENDNLKSGTIRDIAESFLMEHSTPMHISQIADYVMKYRENSTERSIDSNLQASENRFIFFQFGFWGLYSKNYQEFIPNRPHKFFEKEIIKIITKDRLNYVQVVDFFANRDKLLPIQTQIILDKMIKSSILRLENNILHYYDEN